MIKILASLILVVVVGLGGTMLYWSLTTPVVVLGTGEVMVESQFTPGKSAIVPTRKIAQGELRTEQVQLSDGVWVDCAGDCAEAFRRQSLDFWETQKQEGR